MNRTITTLLLLGVSGFALAQDPPTFEEVDKNADGQVSREEASAIEGLDFAAADKDQNGSLSREEYAASQAE
jgi:hypothetical protein